MGLVSAVLWYLAGGTLLLVSVISLLIPFGMRRRRRGDFWTPPASARLPSGEPIPSDMRFFVAPAEVYGRVLFAESGLRAGMTATPVWRRLLLVLVAGLVGFGLGNLMVFWGGQGESDWKWLWWLVPTTGFGVFGWYTTPLVPCRFVCERGVLEGHAFPPGDVLKKGTPRELNFLSARSLRQEDDARGDRTYRWTDEYGNLVHQITTRPALPADAKADLERFVGAILQGWRYFCLVQAFEDLRISSAVRVTTSPTLDSIYDNTAISFHPGEIRFVVEGEPYTLRIEASGEVRFTDWPLREHLRGLAAEAFCERGLHQNTRLLAALR